MLRIALLYRLVYRRCLKNGVEELDQGFLVHSIAAAAALFGREPLVLGQG